jgi:hypothetical protein
MQTSRTIAVNGIEMFMLEQGAGPLVLLCHGWPELSYSMAASDIGAGCGRLSRGGA